MRDRHPSKESGFTAPEPIKVTSVNIMVSVDKAIADLFLAASRQQRNIPTLTKAEEKILLKE